MKSNMLILLLLIIGCKVTLGQNAGGCDGMRYTTKVFSSITKTTVKYGQNLNFGITVELYMDIFEPENDILGERPVVVFAHGGYYMYGNRTEMNSICAEYAQRGYVAATMDYRKLPEGTDLDTINSVEAIIRATQDMKAVVRYFKNDRINNNIFRVDTNFIFVGGYSAGAITALHTAYWSESDVRPDYIDDLVIAEGGLEGQTNNYLDVSSRVHGVINLSGAILRKEWIQANEPPIVSYHGTDDDIVAIGTGLTGETMIMDGSAVIHQQATIVNIPNCLYVVLGGGHSDIYGSLFSYDYYSFLNSTYIFFKEILCGVVSSVSSNLLQSHSIDLFPNPVNDFLEIKHNMNEVSEIMIFDTMGKLVGCWAIVTNSQTINLSHLSDGIYFYLFKNNSVNLSQTGKLIISH